MTAPVATRTAYNLKLDQMESCNCPPACGCQFGTGPNHGGCEFIIGWRVRSGRFGSVVLDGVKFVVAADYPGAIHEGGGHAALFVDSAAHKEQVEAIGAILSGQHGGMPWEALAATVATMDGPVITPLEMTVDGTRSSFRVPGVLDVRQTPLRDGATGADKEVHIVYPKGGFFWNDGSICTTSTMQVKHGALAFSHAGCFSAHAEANWSNG